jgi:hypothetical protein
MSSRESQRKTFTLSLRRSPTPAFDERYAVCHAYVASGNASEW